MILLAMLLSFSLRGGAANVGGQSSLDSWTQTAGASALGREGRLLVTVSLDGTTRIHSIDTGDTRHLFFSAGAGMAIDLSSSLSLHLLGEAGMHRLSATRNGQTGGDCAMGVWSGPAGVGDANRKEC